MPQQIPWKSVVITDADIDDVEEKLGVSFPVQYRDFLLLYNGGEPQSPVGLFYNDIDKKTGSPTTTGLESVDYFLGIGMGKHYELESTYHRYKRDLPDTLFPIGIGFAGNVILLTLTGPNEGRVYWWKGRRADAPLLVATDLVDLLSEDIGEGPLQATEQKRMNGQA